MLKMILTGSVGWVQYLKKNRRDNEKPSRKVKESRK